MTTYRRQAFLSLGVESGRKKVLIFMLGIFTAFVKLIA